MTIWREAFISCFVAGSATVLSFLAGCTTVSLEDAFPAAVQAPPKQDTTPVLRPGEYPNLNVAPQPSGSQLTNDESRAAVEELRQKRARQAAGGGQGTSLDGADELRRLANSHAEETLRAIEGE